MANSSQKLDKIFKEKLDQHEVKPSALAWERLEKELPKEPKSNRGFWWAAAASVVILLSAGYFFYPSETKDNSDELLATNQEIISPDNSDIRNSETTIPDELPTEIEEEQLPAPVEIKEEPKAEITSNKPSNKKPVITEAPTQNLIAMTETREKEITVSEVIIPEEKPELKPMVDPEMELPTLDITKAVAEEKTETEEAPAYSIKIFSSGLKEEPKDKNLIAEIGKTVNDVGGLLGKVDQGLADLQDAKNNLFTNLTSKKERADK
ncbi:hypothetical protein [Algoriphagus halophilus]|uniref:Uncharacterized protein n=1 Tax=Algoriphagus halophilus TaxID=226505 RepID=A0A1N6D6G0_9BACT|nr:hypothetical protein [Algoriphagus halophilus]SIN66349.1 hypothetical protein SAMN05444394_0326 [Algoriphagus halophilus]